MTSDEIKQALDEHLSDKPGYNEAAAQKFADGLGSAMTAIVPPKQPSHNQQQCYAQCQTTRDTAMAACATKPWPVNMLCVAAAVVAFNNCRHQCDQKP